MDLTCISSFKTCGKLRDTTVDLTCISYGHHRTTGNIHRVPELDINSIVAALWVAEGTLRAKFERQLYRDCDLYGAVDIIWGDASNWCVFCRLYLN
ncbi:hypothetical protein ACLOJK_009061 [Asimina triloba]